MIEYELEYLKWKKRQLILQQKYADTPPGLTPEQVKEAAENLDAAWNNYEEHHRFRLMRSAEIPEEPFAGRREELDKIRRFFMNSAGTVFLSGMGGIGKSVLARAYGRLYAGEYDKILLWPYDKSLEQIFADDGQLGISNLAYTQNKYLSRRKYAREKYEKFAQIASQEKLLIILDNYNQMEDAWFALLEELPCDLLVTTRLHASVLEEKKYAVIPVGHFVREEEWIEFYRLYSGAEPDQDTWERIMSYRDSVEGHTLKMKLAFSNPEQQWQAKQFARSLLSGFRLKKTQIQILCELSYLTLQGIPEEVYLSCTEEKREELDFLKARCFVQERREASGQIFLSLHPVISEAVQVTWKPDLTRCLKFVEKFSFYARFSWFRPRSEDLWLMPQVLFLWERLPKPVAWRYYPYECLATFFMVWECFDEARQIVVPLYECVRDYYGEEHQFTAYMAFRVASVYYDSMQFEKSREWYIKSFRMYGAASPANKNFYHDKAEASAKLGRVYEYEENYEAAHRCLDVAMDAMKDFQRTVEEADPELWKLRRNRLPYVHLRRATIYFKQGELERAQQEMDTAMNLFPLDGFQEVEIRRLQARIYLARGEYEKAKEAAIRDLDACVRYQSESYKMSLTCREVLGDILTAMGNTQEANEAYLRTLTILQEKYPHQTGWMERLREKIKM